MAHLFPFSVRPYVQLGVALLSSLDDMPQGVTERSELFSKPGASFLSHLDLPIPQASTARAAEEELNRLLGVIEQKQAELAQVQVALEGQEAKEQALEQEVNECMRSERSIQTSHVSSTLLMNLHLDFPRRQQFLYAKQGQNFGTRAERDAWVKKGMAEAQKIIKKEARALQDIAAQEQQINQQLQAAEQVRGPLDSSSSSPSTATPSHPTAHPLACQFLSLGCRSVHNV